MDEQTLTILLTSFFACACAAIDEMRAHSLALTPPLVAVMLGLKMFTATVVLAGIGD